MTKKLTTSTLKKNGGGKYVALNPRPLQQYSTPPNTAFDKPWLVMPPSWQGSDAEYAVEWALVSLQEPHQFQYRVYQLAEQLGGHRVDFFLPERNTIIRVQGVYFHYQQGGRGDAGTVAFDQKEKEFLEGVGYTVIDIDSDDALTNPRYYVQQAILGIDHSRQARGIA